MKEEFTNTYKHFIWKMGQNETRSGMGSTLKYTENIRKELPLIIEKFSIEKVLDLSCGDWNWQKEIQSHFSDYVGNDIVEEMITENNRRFGSDNIKFISYDMLSLLKKLDNKSLDLVICRQTFDHLKTEYIIKVLNQVKRVSKFALLSTTRNIKNSELLNFDGHSARLVNLQSSPYDIILEGKEIYSFFDTEYIRTNHCMMLFKY